MNWAGDRNLLFGILALHNGFINRDALIRAMSIWVAEQESSLGELLVRHGDLAPDHHFLMEALVKAHLKQHHDDAAASLAAINTTALVKVLAERLEAPAIASRLTLAPQTQHGEPATGDHADGIGASTSSERRFTIIAEAAEGGLGKVYLARDLELNREVALKQIKERYCTDRDSQTRFVAEAEITGGLEHPGIVPVYALGYDRERGPYYAMRFIKGESLRQAILQFHAQGGNDGDRGLLIRKLLGRFVAVCEAIAYAHSRGVIHRDLKPDNIMLGKFGETLVVDWGLAKSVGREDKTKFNNDETTLRPSSGSGGAQTLAGSAIGTPAYMSPEQAAGDVDQIGFGSDIYSLGATLYAILAGRPPVDQKDLQAALLAVRHGDFPSPRTICPRVDLRLEAICMKAMARHPDERYASPQELARDVEHWLADEPVSAYPEPVSARLARWAKRNRAWVRSAAAALFFVIVMAAGLAVHERGVAESERQANALAQRRLDQIEKSTAFMFSIFGDLDFRAQDGGATNKDLRVVLGERLKAAAGQLDAFGIDDPLNAADLQHRLGQSLLNLGYPDAAVELATRAHATYLERLGPRDVDTLASATALARAESAAGRWDEAITLHRATLKALTETRGANATQTLDSRTNLAVALSTAGQIDEAIALELENVGLNSARFGSDSLEAAFSRANLAADYSEAGRLSDAINMGEEIVKIREGKLGPDHALTLEIRHNLAWWYFQSGDVSKAIAMDEETLKRRRDLLGLEHPNTIWSQVDLAHEYAEVGRNEEAIALLEQSLKLRTNRLGPEHPETLQSRGQLAWIYSRTGRVRDAITINEGTIKAMSAKLGDEHPDTLMCRYNLALQYARVGRFAEAIALNEDTLKIRIRTLGPLHIDTLRTENNLAFEYSQVGRTADAATLSAATLKRAVEQLGESNRFTLIVRHNLAFYLQRLGRRADAMVMDEETLRLRVASLGPDDPDSFNSRRNLISHYEALGLWDKAEPLRREFLRRARASGEIDSADVALSSTLLAKTLCKQQRWNEAEPLLRESLAIGVKKRPNEWTHFSAMSLLGEALLGQGRYTDAEDLLLPGLEGLQAREANILPLGQSKAELSDASLRVVRLYEAWGKPRNAEAWKIRLRLGDLPSNVFARTPSVQEGR